MKCTRCGLKEATVRSYINVNGKKQELELCEDCAAELQHNMGFGGYGGLFDEIFGQSSMGLLPGLFKLFDTPTTQKLVCPKCKTTGEEFVKTGFVGCPHCYEVFEPLIVQTVKKLQQSDSHIGKAPIGTVNATEEEARLKAELQAAIDDRNYAKVGEIGERLKKLSDNKHGGEV